MADQRESAPKTDGQGQHASGKGQTAGRGANAAQPHDDMGEHATPERYPSVRQDDSIESPGDGSGESRSFDPSVNTPTPRQGAGDGSPSVNGGRLGPEADPVEGKRG